MNTSLLNLMAKNWWVVLLRGLVAILFGVLAFAWPKLTLIALVILYGAYAFGDGILALAAACTGGSVTPRWWLVIVGLAGLAAGFVTFFYPHITALILLTFIGAFAIIRGIFEIIGAIQLRKEIDNEWLLILSGVVSILFGAFVLIHPGAGALAVVWLIACYSIFFGVLMVGASFRLRSHHHHHDDHLHPPTTPLAA